MRNLLILLQIITTTLLFSQNYSIENAFPNLSFTDPVGIYKKDLEKNCEGLICYIGGEYNPLLFFNDQII